MWNYKDKSFYEQKLYKDLYKNADKMLGYPGIYSMNCRISVFDVEDNKELGCVSFYSMYFCAIDSYPRQFYNLPELLYYLYINNFDLGFIDILKNLRQCDGKARDFSRGMKVATPPTSGVRLCFCFSGMGQRGVKSRANLSPFWGTTYLENWIYRVVWGSLKRKISNAQEQTSENWDQRVGASTLKGEDVRPDVSGCLCRS